jgi:ubiquinone/menaquinone biosynthesis C-methylase UbiE
MGEPASALTTHTAVTGQERPFLPGTSHEWLLPLYDPLSRLFRVGKLHRKLLAQAELQPGQRVLEIGCGTGNLLLAAKATEPDAAMVGLDPDLSALARARRKARRRGLPVQLDRGYADELPYPGASVDRVLSAFMLHHVAATEREKAVREVARVLRPGGRLHLVDIAGHAHAPRLRKAHARTHLPEGIGDGVPDLLRRAGFTEVTETGSTWTRMGRLVYLHATR